MFKFLAILCPLIYAIVAEETVELLPGPLPAAPIAGVAPVAVAPGVVTARSQQYFARNYNALTAPILAPIIARGPVVSPVANGIQYSQFTQFLPSVPVPVAPAVQPIVARPVEPVQPAVPDDDVVEIESARLRQSQVNSRSEQEDTSRSQGRRLGSQKTVQPAPQKLVQESRPVVKSGRLAAAPVLAASAPVGAPVPAIRNILGVPYYL